MKHRTMSYMSTISYCIHYSNDCHYLQMQQKLSSANSEGDDGVYDYSKL